MDLTKKMDNLYMRRSFNLARLGAGNVSPNPLVGAVIVHENRIIGEGFHEQYGQAHAEVNAVNSVKKEDLDKIPESTLYVSLEPCCIHGRTPPCTDLVIKKKFRKVIVSVTDHSPGIKGKGIKILQENKINVTTAVEEEEGERLSAIRKTFVMHNRPYIILKYAQSSDGWIGNTNRQIWMTNEFSKRLVHKWRAETDAIMVGTGTVLVDNPQLTNRLYFGKSPVRVVLDRSLKIPPQFKVFDSRAKTILVTEREDFSSTSDNIELLLLDFNTSFLDNLLHKLAERNLTSLIVEGGSSLLKSFIDAGLWDEARVFHTKAVLKSGVPAPAIPAEPASIYPIKNDILKVYYRNFKSG